MNDAPDPPTPPPKQNPAAMSVARGVKHKGRSKTQSKTTKNRNKKQVTEEVYLAVYDGQIYLGKITTEKDAGFAAISADGDRNLGIFISIKAAADAVDEAFRGAR
jgi:hypothetical protein